jgi:hypothetical protein
MRKGMLVLSCVSSRYPGGQEDRASSSSVVRFEGLGIMRMLHFCAGSNLEESCRN